MDQFSVQQGSPAVSVASQSGPGAVNNGNNNTETAPAFQPDENSKTLYVGNLDQSVNENFLREIFSQSGAHVENVKIIRDKNFAHGGLNYGFVDFADHATAEIALQTMNGRRVNLQEIKVNWAFTGQVAGKEDTATHYHIFIGDISPEINDEALSNAFSAFGSMTDARVMWDSNSGKSRGYGFAAYKERADAERAITSMNGQMLGNRAVRCNWASQRGMPGPAFSHGMHPGGNSFKMVAGQAPQFNTTVYIGNLPPHTTQEDLIPFFQPFGFVVEMRLQADRGFAFVKLESHEKAANAIVRLAGTMVNGRPAKLSWGKDRAAENAARGNHYGYYNNGSGYPMGGHQNNGGYNYQNNYGGYGQHYNRNGSQHHQHHHHNQMSHNNNHHHHHNNHNNHHNHNQNQNHHFQQQQAQTQHMDYESTGAGASGSSALAAGALPGSNGESYDNQFYGNNNRSADNGFGGSR
ncbi:hypothetical protein BGZ81_005102 [Podila clonocystis]|nr:hypothetical protein BGZ81_005102 [Podila clonocystis]